MAIDENTRRLAIAKTNLQARPGSSSTESLVRGYRARRPGHRPGRPLSPLARRDAGRAQPDQRAARVATPRCSRRRSQATRRGQAARAELRAGGADAGRPASPTAPRRRTRSSRAAGRPPRAARSASTPEIRHDHRRARGGAAAAAAAACGGRPPRPAPAPRPRWPPTPSADRAEIGGSGGAVDPAGVRAGLRLRIAPPPPASGLGRSAASRGSPWARLGVPTSGAATRRAASTAPASSCGPSPQVGSRCRTTRRASDGRARPTAEFEAGDLVFFSAHGHVGIYIGGGQFVHAPHTGDVVRSRPRRPPLATSAPAASR